MLKSLRLLALAAVLGGFSAGAASAQTVLLKGAASGDAVQLFVNGNKVADGTVDALGQASLAGQMPVNDANRPEMDSRVYVDACAKRQVVQIIDRNRVVPPREDGCERREIGGVFWIRQRSTVVIDLSGPVPTLLLRQGAYDPKAVGTKRQAPLGLVLSAAGGWGTLNDIRTGACGNVGDCEGKNSGGAWGAGVTFWMTRFLAVEGAYLKPRKASFEGNGTNFRFTHVVDPELFTVSGILAAPVGPVRIYGKGGANFHRATFSTTQTNDPLSFTSEGVTYSTPGGTQIFGGTGEGWSWLVAGGLEGWVSPRFALYGEFSFNKLKGEAKSGTDVPIDGHALAGVAGIRLKVF